MMVKNRIILITDQKAPLLAAPEGCSVFDLLSSLKFMVTSQPQKKKIAIRAPVANTSGVNAKGEIQSIVGIRTGVSQY